MNTLAGCFARLAGALLFCAFSANTPLRAQVTVLGEGCPAAPGLAISVAGNPQIGGTFSLSTTAPGAPLALWVLGVPLPTSAPAPNPCCTPQGHPLICCPAPGPRLWVNPLATFATGGAGGLVIAVPPDPSLAGFELGAQAAVGDPMVCLRMTQAIKITL